MWKLARTPRWIAALVFAMLVACIFAVLGQWQLARAIESGTVVSIDTETVVPIERLTEPQVPMTDAEGGRMVEVTGAIVEGSGTVLSGRINGGEVGYWAMGQLVTAEGASLAIAAGWSTDEATAASAARQLGAPEARYEGRYTPPEDPVLDDYEAGERRTASVAALINEWPDAPDTVYAGYLVLADPLGGLDVIDSPSPSSEVSLNWLNVFYAIEWVVFAGLAFFLWYRLVKDAYERELEEAEERELDAVSRVN